MTDFIRKLPIDSALLVLSLVGLTCFGQTSSQTPAPGGPLPWEFQSPKKSPVPQITSASNPIDAFLLTKLREKGLDFAPKADNKTLLRRLSFDLTGLPPASESLNEKYETAVERLLASPHYGERWGRHWLDVVRYGET